MEIGGRPTTGTDALTGSLPGTTRSEVIFFLTKPHVVWGATAAIIDNLLHVLVGETP